MWCGNKPNKKVDHMKLSVRNWITYPALKLDLDTHQVHIFTGKTGCGKSSIIDAITWALTGLARNYTAKKDSALFKMDPISAMSVKVTCTGDQLESIKWPAVINRTTTKVTIQPDEIAEDFKARERQIRACLGVWGLLGMKAVSRAAMLGSLSAAAGIDQQDIVTAIRECCKAPAIGSTFNGITWGGWDDISDAELNATDIRRSYHAVSKGSIPEVLTDRIAGNKEAVEELTATLSSDEAKPQELIDLQKKLEDLQSKIKDIPKRERPPLEPPVSEKAFEKLTQQKETAETVIAATETCLAEINPFVDGLVNEFDGEAVDKTAAWRDSIVQRQKKSKTSIKSIESQHKNLKDSLEQWKTETHVFSENDKLRTSLGQKILKAEEAIKNFTDPRLIEIKQLKQQIVDDEAVIAEINEKAIAAQKKYSNWDAIVKSLTPNGEIASSFIQDSTEGLSAERIAKASEIVGVDVSIGNDGTIHINRLSERQPSRGQRLLAGLVLQDAFCQAFNVPLMLVDELEALDADECLGKAVAFLREVAGDYEAVIGCRTGDPSSFDGMDLDSVHVWHCRDGKVESANSGIVSSRA